MGKDFDFSRIGKRMPYKMPEGCFDEMEAVIWNEVRPEHAASAGRKTFRMRILAGVLAVAASITLFFMLRPSPWDAQADGFSKVEQAFANLSPEDRAYMLEVYQDDIFMNE